MSEFPKPSTQEAKQALLEEALPLAMGIATHYANIPGVSLDEIRSDARLAAWDAARTFDFNRGVEFSQYAGRVVRNRLKSLFRKESLRKSNIPHSLDYQFCEQDTGTLLEQIPGENNDVVDSACLREASSVLKQLINELPHRERDYLLAYMNGETTSEIVRKMGITRQSLHAIKRKALEHIRRDLAQKSVYSNIQLMKAPAKNISHRQRESIDDFLDDFQQDSEDDPGLSSRIELAPSHCSISISELPEDQVIDLLLPDTSA